MTGAMGDLRFAFRGRGRSPLFTTVAIVSLALGIGANTAIFTLLDQLMLRSLPVRDPNDLVMLYQKGAHNGSNMGLRMHFVSHLSGLPEEVRRVLGSPVPARSCHFGQY